MDLYRITVHDQFKNKQTNKRHEFVLNSKEKRAQATYKKNTVTLK